MSLLGEQILLRVYVRSADRAPFTPSHQLIVKEARHRKLAGATVIRGILGAGHRGLVQPSTWSITEDVPVVVEIVDSAANIAAFVREALDQIMVGGMATLERAAVMMYRHRDQEKSPPLRLANVLEPLSTVPEIQPGNHMTLNENGVLLRVFLGESDRHEGKPLYEAIVAKVRELGIAGATVLRGSSGFGARSVVHKSALLEMSSDLPIVIEIVDSEEKVNLLLPHLETMVREGMITMEHVVVLLYRDNKSAVS